MATIARITRYDIRHYSDNDQIIACCGWVDTKGKTGTTRGHPDNTHMQALAGRAVREAIPITRHD